MGRSCAARGAGLSGLAGGSLAAQDTGAWRKPDTCPSQCGQGLLRWPRQVPGDSETRWSQSFRLLKESPKNPG